MNKWNIEFYEKTNNDNIIRPAFEYINSLEPKLKAKVEREIDLLEEFGINLIYPHTKKIQGGKYDGLWELRIKCGTNISRIFYFAFVKNKFILLHGFTKKSKKTPPNQLEIAYSYMIDYIKKHSK